MTYNLTAVSNSTDILASLQAVNNDILGGWLGVLWLIGLAMVFFMGYYWSTKHLRQSVIGTCFVTFLLTLILKALSLINNLAVFITLVACGFAIGFVWTHED